MAMELDAPEVSRTSSRRKRQQQRHVDGRFAPFGPLFCHTCGQKVRRLNPHRMDAQKVRVLELLAMSSIEGNQWVKAREGGSVEIAGTRRRAPYLARVHCNRLMWFGLVRHDDERRSGRYSCTPLGLQFLLGKARVPARIYCKDGRVVTISTDTVSVDQVRNVVLDKAYWDNYAALQRI